MPGVNDFIKVAVGILLVAVSSLLLMQRRIEKEVAGRHPTAKSFTGMAIIGLFAGFLVGMTSVGSGSIIMMLLLMFYSYPPKVMVGTDIVHAVILTGVTSFLHFRLGNVDPSLVAYLLIGSIPGRNSRVEPQHPGSSVVVAPDSVRDSAEHRHQNVVDTRALPRQMTDVFLFQRA